jgi:acetyl-CoA C-acetyltransferase
VERLRDDPGAAALTTALGWYVTKHGVGVLSGIPPAAPFREIDADPLVRRPPARAARTDYTGNGAIEAFTVPYGRDGTPEALIVSALTPEGDRVLTRSADADTIAWALGSDPLGATVELPGLV